MKRVYVALGSNMGVSKTHLSNAIEALQSLASPKSFQLSPWYRSAPIGGPEDQPDFTNAVCTFFYTESPLVLLRELQRIEQLEGRERIVRWGPRTLDLDIIWMEGETSNTDELALPHPRAHERAFVLKPLLDLNASFLLNNQALTTWFSNVSEQVISPTEL